jgi:hypothetical protein
MPQDLFERDEQALLLPVPTHAFESVIWKKATVHTDAHVSFERRLYSVPWKRIGQTVWLRATASTVAIYALDDSRLATHPRRGDGPRSTQDEHLPEYRVALRHRSRDYWEERASRMGEEVAAYVREVFDTDDVLSQLRNVQAIVTHLETFPVERARAAVRRASFYACYQYRSLKNILRQALDLDPLPSVQGPLPWGEAKPQFARPITDLLATDREVRDEPN